MTVTQNMPVPPYRSGTKLTDTEVALVFNAGGIGDYINWVPAIRYAIDSNPHIKGFILTPEYFADLAHLWLGQYSPRFKVVTYDRLEDNEIIKTTTTVAPTRNQFANACGFHLMHLGFIYYTQIGKAPQGAAILPAINGNETEINPFLLPDDYAVITTMSTARARTLPAEVINQVTDHLRERGITPVFLGREELTETYKAKNAAGIKTAGVIDLREKTTLTEAACIMAKAKFVFGLDNGLLHLASCSTVPVIAIFTTVDPTLRISPRRDGAKTYTIIPPDSLPCRFCNTKMRYVIGHDFNDCLYDDTLCLNGIEANTIISVIDQILNPAEIK